MDWYSIHGGRGASTLAALPVLPKTWPAPSRSRAEGSNSQLVPGIVCV